MQKFLLLLVLLIPIGAKAQQENYGKNLKVENLAAYHAAIQENADNRLVEIKAKQRGIKLDIRYATRNNFMGRPMYTQARAFARLPVYTALVQIQQELRKQGLGLKIYDAYRPYSVTVKFYETAKDTTFVADPRKGSRHNRGCAIDLTIIDLKTGKELEMPTGYDSFAPAAAANYDKTSVQATKNRKLLQDVMLAHGFQVLPSEWWHFDYSGWNKFELIDISFSQL